MTYCPKCGEQKQIRLTEIFPGKKFSCVDCGTIWMIQFVSLNDEDETRPTLHAGDGATPAGASWHSLSGTSQAEPGFNNPPRA